MRFPRRLPRRITGQVNSLLTRQVARRVSERGRHRIPGRAPRRAGVGACFVLAVFVGFQSPAAPAHQRAAFVPRNSQASPAERIDPRSQELLKFYCSAVGRSEELTFFGNGTLRVRRAKDGEKALLLAELDPREVASYKSRLTDERPGQPQHRRRGVGGEGVDQCELVLDLGGGRVARRYRFSRMDALPLELSRVVSIADELLREANLRHVSIGFPPGYKPRVGDVVRREDGEEFEIRRFTADGRGVEIQGVSLPIVFYIPHETVALEFAALVRRTRPR